MNSRSKQQVFGCGALSATAAILGNQLYMDVIKTSEEVVAAAVALKKREPSLEHVVLECTNMPPYREAIEAATGMKTWALTDDERLLRPFRGD